MSRDNKGTKRRTFLKASGATGAAGLMAGCLGNGNGNGNGEEPQVDDPDELPEVEALWHHLGTPDTTLHNHRQAVTVQELMDRWTDGRFTIDIAPAGELAGDVESIEQAQEGAIDIIAGIAEGHVAPFWPDINVIGMPFTYPDVSVANYVWDHTDFGHMMREEMGEDMDLEVISWYDNGGMRCYTSNEQLTSVEDFEGQSFRNMDIEAHLEITRSLGAAAEPIDWTELYEALDTGVVNGQENAIPTIPLENLQEVQDYLFLTNHVYSINFAYASNVFWNDLHPTYQSLLKRAGAFGAMHARKVNRLQRIQLLTVFEEEYGMTITSPTLEEFEQMQEMTQGPVGDIIRGEVSDEGLIDQQQEAIETAIEEIGYDMDLGVET